MYQDHFGLRELPFELTANPKYLFLAGRHREALSTLEYGLSTAKGLTVLLGEAGTGKTTLLRAALQSERCKDVHCVYVLNPALTRGEFIETLSAEFGLPEGTRLSKASLLKELEALLRERRSRGQITALMIDEAQSLSYELLEEVRLMANIETPTEKLLPVVLAGQPELAARLNDPRLRQLKQRVTLRCEIARFTASDTAAYIARRIKTAGGEAIRLFTREAVMSIHQRSGGIPRTINVICDNALLTAFGMGRTLVDSGVVLEVAHDFDLSSSGVVYHDSDEDETETAEEADEPAADAPTTNVVAIARPGNDGPPPEGDVRDAPESKVSASTGARSLFSFYKR